MKPRRDKQAGNCTATDCFGTRSKRMRFSSWSSSSITAARGYMCSISKWNWTPAGGSRRKFLLSYHHSAKCQQQERSQEQEEVRLTADRARICCWMVSSSL